MNVQSLSDSAPYRRGTSARNLVTVSRRVAFSASESRSNCRRLNAMPTHSIQFASLITESVYFVDICTA